MKQFWSILISGTISLSLLAGCTSQKAPEAQEKLSVYTSFYPMADFVSKIGGDKLHVVNMVPDGAEPHHWEPSASDIVGLEKADVFVYSGAGMEHWVEDVLASLENKELVVVQASDGLELLEGHKHSHDEDEHEEEHEDEDHDEDEHDHGSYDPHVWLSPMNAKHEMENIKNALVKADIDNASYYEDNFSKYAAEFDKLDQEYKDTLSVLPRNEIVVSHQAFGYLCHAYGLEQLGIDGLVPDSEPAPARMAEIIDFVKEHQVTTIFFAELASPKVAETIASATGASTAVLSAIEGLNDEQKAGGGDYFSVMRENLDALKAALQ